MSTKAILFAKQLKGMQVAALRMVTGEEIIARVKLVEDGSEGTDYQLQTAGVIVDQPRVLLAQLQTKSDGTPFFAAQILNWFNSNPDKEVTISFEDIISVCEPDEGIQQEYIRFTTGIELATSSIIK